MALSTNIQAPLETSLKSLVKGFILTKLTEDKSPRTVEYYQENLNRFLLGHSDLDMVKRYTAALGMEDALKAHKNASPADNLGIKWDIEMPKLDYPKITKGDAITAFLKLYRKEPDFKKELSSIRKPYIPILSKFVKDSLAFFKSGNISPTEYYQAVIDYNEGKTKKDPFPAEKFRSLSDLQPYFDSLGELAYKWKLRVPWVVLALFHFDLIDLLKVQGLPDEVDTGKFSAFSVTIVISILTIDHDSDILAHAIL